MAKQQTSGGRGGSPKWTRVEAQGPLRLHLLEFEAEIGLTFRKSDRSGEPGRVRSIQDETTSTPKGLLEGFADEVAAMRRFGKAVNRCNTISLPPYRAYCLSHYSYDGLCAMLFVEQEEGGFMAAWSERETDNLLAAHPVLVHGGEADLRAFLKHAMLATHGLA